MLQASQMLQEDPVLKNQSYDWSQIFSIIKWATWKPKIQHHDLYNIGHDIGRYWFQIMIMILIMILVNIDRGDPVEILLRSCGV